MAEEQTTSSGSPSETQDKLDPKAETATTSGSSETPETTTQPSASDDLQRELDRLRASLKRANAEAKEHRERATELAQFKEQTEASKLSDQEKQVLAQKKIEQQLSEHQMQNSDLLRQLQESRITNEVFKNASKLNIVDIDAASKLVDASRIDYDDAGNPTNIDALLKELIKARPWLAGKPQPQTSGGATNPPRSQTSGPQEITKEYAMQALQNGNEAWMATPEQERLRIRKFIKDGGLLRR